MSVFPKIKLRPEVEEYLQAAFKNDELISDVGPLEAERKYERLLNNLSHPPAFTTVRVNTHLASVEHVRSLLSEEIHKQYKGFSVPFLEHPDLPDILLIPIIGPRKDLQELTNQVIVGAQCGNAVLRGAHVYAPGIISASKFTKAGDEVSVYSDIEGKCKRGAKEFLGTKVFLGNGISEVRRNDIFNSNGPLKGLGVKMTEPIYLSPSFDNVLSSYIFLQNLPSSVVSYVLNPQPGEKILDMCAAPGGKTTHLATLMHDEGEVIAMDKIADKVKKIGQNAALLQLNCIKTFCYDSTKALTTNQTECGQGGPPFLPESFDRILLDAPCSGMGQRPNMAYSWSLKEMNSYQPLQRKLFRVAVQLLKPEGILVYSTCTITLSENEEQVAWALQTFPCLRLQSQEPHVGREGMKGAGLSPEQLKQLQRFDPSDTVLQGIDFNSLQDFKYDDLIKLANKDCIGFFIAKFMKVQ
ncbi:tRNA (cytosine(72)-C(5))-methyltransferase NSUN6 [Sphaerodactylus townsendi]|uniref:tRNA (cytosine(72)-C(5))-methyltransferase NSUN6 n=1 Tax=Sphaerodactylus townsendi TaxID=933632 RepID=UPI0020260AAD|nr:tRNA (cytosine(72)-C(5))-methyltransferase NSUN6 [Sphaerodactylus townsendi]XP_048366627.1 tRNA (cytosine(72)-C(5))-methyltransferase NSUN6 [Sphaerodactylus townsendi]XP_048366628.1 tRNA (cytosine(72)-C(5))-methyltransferase NSUN6 [Sphaerodactylus townsendi]XP_048366629.1 tRNA (cytosine(72)-C(5))-methyltransferase NSUN6 [Sphaerodactylus townsendi]XP_048366630.1 tRNA (cytosine(72)-C(5))-methyltransferase NSUN6 [Sphaerodactylus townsendi]XP_048366631.1 tRNA (cytosine(72)-C(5))-methyltransfera